MLMFSAQLLFDYGEGLRPYNNLLFWDVAGVPGLGPLLHPSFRHLSVIIVEAVFYDLVKHFVIFSAIRVAAHSLLLKLLNYLQG